MSHPISDEMPQDPGADHRREKQVAPPIPPQENDPARSRKQPKATGEHTSVRSTGTDNRPLMPIEPGLEELAHQLNQKEPEDNLPDQLDRNK